MDPFLLSGIVSLLVVEGCCFTCAYNNIFRRLHAIETRLSSMEAARIATGNQSIPTAVPVSTFPSPAPSAPAAQVYYYPPQMTGTQTRIGGDDPLPVTYATYYQNNR